MEYEDFQVKIEPDGEGRYVVHVLASPAGESHAALHLKDSAPFTGHRRCGADLPPNLDELRRRAAALGRQVRASAEPRPGHRDIAPKAESCAPALSPQRLGGALFAALFSGDTLELYNQSLGVISTQPGHGLRLRLHFALSRPDLVQLSSLPWEFLYRANRNEFLSLNRATPVVRYLDVPQPVQALSSAPPLRILAASASPAHLPPLELAKEICKLREELQGYPQLELHLLEHATRKTLSAALLAQSFHVFHFMGHGGFETPTGRGHLVLEGPEGGPDPLTGEQLSVLLQQPDSPRLAFLNACDTARATRRDGLDPFAGVAAALVLGGLPAVIAMQFPMSDAAAITFSAAFYQRVATSMPVDTAVAEARIALYARHHRSLEWGTPVLFLRAGDGRLFDLSRVPVEEKREAERLAAGCYDEQLDAFDLALSSQAVDLSQKPASLSRLERAQRRIEVVSTRSAEEWTSLTEALLTCRSPLAPFAGTLHGWRPRPANQVWRVEGGDLLGLGADAPDVEPAVQVAPNQDLAARSALTWHGLRFRDGVLSAQMWWPNLGGGGGLSLREAPGQGSALGLLRLTENGAVMAELWQQESLALALLATAPLPALPRGGWYDIALKLEASRASLRVGETLVEGHLTADLAPGFAGLVKLGGAAVRFRDLRLKVYRRVEPAFASQPSR